jgi:hypothetical protein
MFLTLAFGSTSDLTFLDVHSDGAVCPRKPSASDRILDLELGKKRKISRSASEPIDKR